MRPLSTNDILRYIRRGAMLPNDTEETYSEQDLIDMINEELDINLVKMLQDVNEEYDVADLTYDMPGESDNYSLKIPTRATANKLRAVKLVDSSGNLLDLTRVTLDSISDYPDNGNVFHVQGDEVKFLSGTTNTTDQVRMYYHLNQSTLVPDDEVGIISTISSPYDTVIDTETVSVIDITFAEMPSDYASTPLFDFVMVKSPNKILALDKAYTAINPATNTITFRASDIPDRIAVGDIVAAAEETIYPAVPSEMHPVLAMSVVVRICEFQGDELMAKQAADRYEKMKNNVLSLLDNRVEGSPLKFRMKYNTINGATGRTNRTFRTTGGLD